MKRLTAYLFGMVGLALAMLISTHAQAQRYLVKAACVPGLTPDSPSATVPRVFVNAVGGCAKWECVDVNALNQITLHKVTYCGTRADMRYTIGYRVLAIEQAANPLQSLQTAGNRFTIVPLSHPSMAWMPK